MRFKIKLKINVTPLVLVCPLLVIRVDQQVQSDQQSPAAKKPIKNHHKASQERVRRFAPKSKINDVYFPKVNWSLFRNIENILLCNSFYVS